MEEPSFSPTLHPPPPPESFLVIRWISIGNLLHHTYIYVLQVVVDKGAEDVEFIPQVYTINGRFAGGDERALKCHRLLRGGRCLQRTPFYLIPPVAID